MKLLLLATVIAFILEDSGTFQEKPIDQCSDVKLLEQFKNYALELVEAAIAPLRDNDSLEGAGECLSGIDVFEYVNDMDAILATMSIAENHREALDAIQNTSDSELSALDVEDGLMENIRVILAVLETPLTQIHELSEIKTYKKYLLKHDQDPFAATAATSDKEENLKSLLKCFRTLGSVETNKKFFDQLSDGFEIIRQLMTGDNDANAIDSRRARVNQIIKNIPKYRLKSEPAKTEDELREFVAMLAMEDSLQDTDMDWDWDTD